MRVQQVATGNYQSQPSFEMRLMRLSRKSIINPLQIIATDTFNGPDGSGVTVKLADNIHHILVKITPEEFASKWTEALNTNGGIIDLSGHAAKSSMGW